MSTERRLIDANSEIATIKENVCKNCNSYEGVRCRSCWVDDAIGFLKDAPTVDAVEVVHGRWIDAREYCGDYMCSNCDALYGTNKFKYCPNCGAKMDGGNEDGC